MTQTLPKGWNTFVYTLNGDTVFGSNDSTRIVKPFHNIVFGQEGDYIEASVNSGDDDADGARFIVVSGMPLDQPVVQYGPFVLTDGDDVLQAMLDFQTSSNGFEKARGWESEIGKRMEF